MSISPCTSPRRTRTRWSSRRWAGRRARTGTVNAKAFNLITPEGPEAPASPNAPAGARGGGRGPARLGPTQAELTAYLESVKSQVAGGAVLVGKPIFVPVNLTPAAGRLTDEQVKCRFDETRQRCRNAPARAAASASAAAAARPAAAQPRPTAA